MLTTSTSSSALWMACQKGLALRHKGKIRIISIAKYIEGGPVNLQLAEAIAYSAVLSPIERHHSIWKLVYSSQQPIAVWQDVALICRPNPKGFRDLLGVKYRPGNLDRLVLEVLASIYRDPSYIDRLARSLHYI